MTNAMESLLAFPASPASSYFRLPFAGFKLRKFAIRPDSLAAVVAGDLCHVALVSRQFRDAGLRLVELRVLLIKHLSEKRTVAFGLLGAGDGLETLFVSESNLLRLPSLSFFRLCRPTSFRLRDFRFEFADPLMEFIVMYRHASGSS